MSAFGTYKGCATAGATVDPAVPPHLHRHQSCEACDGIGYVRPDGSTYNNRRQSAQARRRTVGPNAAARRCDCCVGTGAHRIA